MISPIVMRGLPRHKMQHKCRTTRFLFEVRIINDERGWGNVLNFELVIDVAQSPHERTVMAQERSDCGNLLIGYGRLPKLRSQ
jgi:hypothetical protein